MNLELTSCPSDRGAFEVHFSPDVLVEFHPELSGRKVTKGAVGSVLVVFVPLAVQQPLSLCDTVEEFSVEKFVT